MTASRVDITIYLRKEFHAPSWVLAIIFMGVDIWY